MHDTALKIGGLVIEQYCPAEAGSILEIGSLDVNGSLRQHRPQADRYIGLDFSAGEGVDHVISEGEAWPVADSAFDLVIASSVLEHDPLFWTTFVDMLRKVRPGGHVYLSAPSNGWIHRYPLDCWRFYPDSAVALAKWAEVQGFPVRLVESFTAQREGDVWNDWCAVFRREPSSQPLPESLVCEEISCSNIICWKSDEILKFDEKTEDMRIIAEERDAREEAQQQLTILRDAVDEATEREQALTSRLEALAAENESQATTLRELDSARVVEARAALEREKVLVAQTSALEADVTRLRTEVAAVAEENRALAASADDLRAELAKAAEQVRRAERVLADHRARTMETKRESAMREALVKEDLRGILREKREVDRQLLRTTTELSQAAKLLRETLTERNGAVAQREWLLAVLDVLQSVPASRVRFQARKRRERIMARLGQRELFDALAYLQRYPDVAASGMDPLDHYLRHGMAEGREPGKIEKQP